MGHELGLGLQGLRGLDGSRDAKEQTKIQFGISEQRTRSDTCIGGSPVHPWCLRCEMGWG